MTRRFTHNVNFISDLRKSAVFNPVAIIAMPLSILFYIIGLSLNKEILSVVDKYIYEENTVFNVIKIFFWVGLILSIILCIMYAVYISNKDYIRATNCGAAMCGYAGGECLVFMFNEDVGYLSEVANLKSFFIIFFILFFAVFVGEMIYPKFIEKNNIVIIDNLEKSYLELSESGISGINITNASLPSNGSYFEITYGDIRNIRTSHPDAQTKQYFNLFLDTKYGTYNMLIDQNVTACDIAKKAINDNLQGKEINLFANMTTGFNSNPVQAQYQATTGQWYCPNCGKPNQDYVGTCGCGTRKP